MNTMRNSIQLMGRLGLEPIIRLTKTGSKMAALRIATHQFSKNESGEWTDHVHWHNLVVWGRLVKTVELQCTKGTHVLIEGALTYKDFVDNSGVKRTNAEIKVRELQVIDKIIVQENT